MLSKKCSLLPSAVFVLEWVDSWSNVQEGLRDQIVHVHHHFHRHLYYVLNLTHVLLYVTQHRSSLTRTHSQPALSFFPLHTTVKDKPIVSLIISTQWRAYLLFPPTSYTCWRHQLSSCFSAAHACTISSRSHMHKLRAPGPGGTRIKIKEHSTSSNRQELSTAKKPRLHDILTLHHSNGLTELTDITFVEDQ